MTQMITVKLTCPGWPVQRQTPGQKGVWGNCRFLCNTEGGCCDYWFVMEGLAGKTDKALCPKENVIFITAEPPALRTYKQVFLNQFAAVITCHD